MVRLLLLSGLIALLAACNAERSQTTPNTAASPAEDCQTVQHRAGKTQVCGQPQRIVVLNPKMLDILLSLDVQPIGYAEVFSNLGKDFDQPSQQIPYVGDRITRPLTNLGISGEPSLEKLARLQPDLILGDITGNEDEYPQLSQIAPTLLFEYVGHDNWQEPLRAIASAVNRTEQAEAVIKTYQQQLETTRQALAPVVKKYPTVLMVASEQLTPPVELVTSVDFCGGLLEDLGFQLALPSQDEPKDITQTISIEVLPQLDADLIIVQGHNFTELSQIKTVNNFENGQLQAIKQAWSKNSIAQSLPASQENRVYFIPTYICRGLPSPIGSQLALEQLQTQLSSRSAAASPQ
ncbi:iron-siderophore ABC transporter substrate-binding protein [Phormidium tenue FACHB-886]|nr:iron-siderophore ABC transporter substrate-binding protein [Phormidium tenue FACHB-886]